MGLQASLYFTLWTVTDPILLVTSPLVYFGVSLGDVEFDNWNLRLRCLRCSWVVCASDVLVRQIFKVTTFYSTLVVA